MTDLKGKTEPNRWAVLALLGVAQLMVTLDVTIVNIALHLITNVRPQTRPRIGFPGVLVASAGLFSLVYGLSSAETHSWSAPVTIIALIASAVLLGAFVVLENHAINPLLPLHIVWNRVRAGSYATMFIIGSGIFAQYLFLSFYMQKDLGFSPIETGLGFLPFTVTVAFTSIRAQKTILPRVGVKWLIMIGSALAVIGQVLFTRLSPGGNYGGRNHRLGTPQGFWPPPARGTSTRQVHDREREQHIRVNEHSGHVP